MKANQTWKLLVLKDKIIKQTGHFEKKSIKETLNSS